MREKEGRGRMRSRGERENIQRIIIFRLSREWKILQIWRNHYTRRQMRKMVSPPLRFTCQRVRLIQVA